MKHLKKLMALMIAVIMCIAMAVPTMAEDTKYAITVDTSNDAVEHTYKVYQIFTGTPQDGKLVDLKYGHSYAGKTETDPVPKSEIDAIGTSKDDVRAWIATTFGEGATNIGDAVATLNSTTTSYDAVPGYYLVLDTNYTATDDTKDAYSAFMIQVVDQAATFTPKKEVPEVDKQVKDETADAESGATNGWGETADHEIGETFQFKLIATIPADENLKAYDSYMVRFNDTMNDAITFEKINSVKVNNTTINAGTGDAEYASTADENQKGGAWTLTIPDIKKVPGIVLGDAPITIEVEYDAHLNEDAYVNAANGPTTNENKVTLTYSNNPDATGVGETDTTPEDKVFVFTYKNTGTKVDANNQPVAGAGFVLYKIEAANAQTIANSTEAPTGTVVPLYKNSKGYLVYDASNEDAYTGGATVANNEIITTATDGGNVFSIVGLDVGTYALYEKTVPEGYTQAKNTVFTITAEHSETQKDVPNVDLGNSTVSETITNYTGSTLPSTGGIGTTIFYVIGAVLVVGAGIVLVTRRRMSAN